MMFAVGSTQKQASQGGVCVHGRVAEWSLEQQSATPRSGVHFPLSISSYYSYRNNQLTSDLNGTHRSLRNFWFHDAGYRESLSQIRTHRS